MTVRHTPNLVYGIFPSDSHDGEDILDWNLQFGELDKQIVFSAASFLLEE